MNLKPSQIIAIGAAVVFGPSIIVGLVVGHFFGLWFGVAVAGFVLIVVIAVTHRQVTKVTRGQRDEAGTKGGGDHP